MKRAFIQKTITMAFAIITCIFTFVPEDFFGRFNWIPLKITEYCPNLSVEDIPVINLILSKIGCFFIIWVITAFLYLLFLVCRPWITFEGLNYRIRVEYGDIHKKKKCHRVVNFDECFTTIVGTAPGEVKRDSICGQYLLQHPETDVEKLIHDGNITPSIYKSKYKNKICYPSGTLVPKDDDMLMAFAKLDEHGHARFFSRDEYIDCLNLLWKELEYYRGEKDVCVPILGAGRTSFDGGSGASIPQQELLDMMIWSYKLSSHKIKSPYKLRIICKRNEGFSINNIHA